MNDGMDGWMDEEIRKHENQHIKMFKFGYGIQKTRYNTEHDQNISLR